MDAHAALTALRAAGLPVRGLTVRDPDNDATWRFEGPLTAADRDRARAIVATYRTVPSTSAFWPAPPTPLERDVARIKQTLHLEVRR